MRRGEPVDDEISEVWERLPREEIYLRGVEALTGRMVGGWQVEWSAGEHFRRGLLGVELRERMQSALRAVPGVTNVQELRWETWHIDGTPSGEALCQTAANVLDEYLDRMHVAYETGDF